MIIHHIHFNPPVVLPEVQLCQHLCQPLLQRNLFAAKQPHPQRPVLHNPQLHPLQLLIDLRQNLFLTDQFPAQPLHHTILSATVLQRHVGQLLQNLIDIPLRDCAAMIHPRAGASQIDDVQRLVRQLA